MRLSERSSVSSSCTNKASVPDLSQANAMSGRQQAATRMIERLMRVCMEAARSRVRTAGAGDRRGARSAPYEYASGTTTLARIPCTAQRGREHLPETIPIPYRMGILPPRSNSFWKRNRMHDFCEGPLPSAGCVRIHAEAGPLETTLFWRRSARRPRAWVLRDGALLPRERFVPALFTDEH